MLSPTPRTLLRLFLLFGGLGLLLVGIQDGSTSRIALGVLAAILGGFGLLWEIRQSNRNEP